MVYLTPWKAWGPAEKHFINVYTQRGIGPDSCPIWWRLGKNMSLEDKWSVKSSHFISSHLFWFGFLIWAISYGGQMKLLGTLLHMPGIKKPSLVVILEELCNRWYMTFIKIKTFLSSIFLSLLLTSMGKKIYTHLVAYCQNRFSQDSSRHPSVTNIWIYKYQYNITSIWIYTLHESFGRGEVINWKRKVNKNSYSRPFVTRFLGDIWILEFLQRIV